MTRVLLTLLLLVAAAGPSKSTSDVDPQRSAAVPSEDLVLLEMFYENRNRCRMRDDEDGVLTVEEIDLACARRETLRDIIVDKEYCRDQSGVKWVKCRALPVPDVIAQRSTATGPREWWHGTFVKETLKEHGCEDTDAAVTHGGSVVYYWEQSCAVLRSTELPEMHAVVLQMRCMGESDTGPEFDRQEVLMSHARDRAEMPTADLTSLPSGFDLARCAAE